MNASRTSSLEQAHASSRKSTAAWVMTAALAAAAALGMAQNAKAQTIWTVAMHEAGVHVALSNAPQYPVVVQQPAVVYPVAGHHHRAPPVMVVPQHEPRGHAYGHWRHHHRHHHRGHFQEHGFQHEQHPGTGHHRH
jgi:hypothetical protein